MVKVPEFLAVLVKVVIVAELSSKTGTELGHTEERVGDYTGSSRLQASESAFKLAY